MNLPVVDRAVIVGGTDWVFPNLKAHAQIAWWGMDCNQHPEKQLPAGAVHIFVHERVSDPRRELIHRLATKDAQREIPIERFSDTRAVLKRVEEVLHIELEIPEPPEAPVPPRHPGPVASNGANLNSQLVKVANQLTARVRVLEESLKTQQAAHADEVKSLTHRLEAVEGKFRELTAALDDIFGYNK